jgi:hypothetical protein
MTLRITGFLDFGDCPVFKKLDLFPSSGEEETPTLLGPLEKANLSHWTTHVRDKVTLLLVVYRQSVCLGGKPLETQPVIFCN